MSGLGQPVRIKYILSLAFIAARTRPPTDRPLKPPGKNWAKAFEKRHPQTAARRIMAIDWNRHDKNTAAKMTHWLEAIGQILRNPAILADNVYNMDETGVMLSMLGSVKALIERIERGGVNAIGKEHFTSLHKPTIERAFTPKNIKASFAARGMFPFNPERVLRTVPKLPAELTLAVTNEVPCQDDTFLQTPVTPVSAEDLMSLQNLILQRDAHALDDMSKQNLQRHLLKFAKAAQLILTKSALQQNHT
ncbi:hypothetical protein PtrSN002B_010562 [Pyrenophora tritici-repentis]|nr:hypothetical protein PtrSN001A_010318 [Pyrenophora tritici-repentis]KAI1532408.1 hypothetical protein PtrSN002B_010562 [Pyrenophora tritici-repentis]KAI1564011.1 hypothetical protein PtrEW7m1_010366 [Pyrenophora tritici-repentis]KAI1579047.1 hypothetical protein PtrEW13061_010263 [Pyrenophora tritici-repentis]KAI1595303.1 hypothetical protein PtrCC142_010412 [Pyrenophora tritici-repentis]